MQGNIIRNFEGQSFGEHTLTDALVKSINTTMAKVGLELGAPTFREYFSRFQLDQRPELSLPANAGQIGNPNRSQVALAWSALGGTKFYLLHTTWLRFSRSLPIMECCETLRSKVCRRR